MIADPDWCVLVCFTSLDSPLFCTGPSWSVRDPYAVLTYRLNTCQLHIVGLPLICTGPSWSVRDPYAVLTYCLNTCQLHIVGLPVFCVDLFYITDVNSTSSDMFNLSSLDFH
ncbi:hypothetical protein PoB_004901600 [Plakobranchus ocellatus]|uniref:Uncharacterized protein n=1 Tax=Plakobranchus ocellatus TaxID=259542 RepID=A0AAV4BGP1_9GAST|nr:hypothetical protein PoB_004901600 [Plakobranchus ocellatus]